MDVLFALLWIPSIIAWCMCVYILLASREGFHWFSLSQNPYLIGLAVGGAVVAGLGLAQPHSLSVVIAAGCYSFYAMLVSTLHWRFRQWRIIIPVNIPLVALVAWTVYLELPTD